MTDAKAILSSIPAEVTAGLWRAYRALIPELHHRIPVSWGTAPYQISSYLPLVFMAYLARRPNTYFTRLLLLPLVVLSSLVGAYHYVWVQPTLNVYNWGQCLFAAVAIAKALEYALTPEGMLKIGELRPGIWKGKSGAKKFITNGHHHPSNGYSNHHDGDDDLGGDLNDNNHNSIRKAIGSGLYDAFELLHTQRGPKWAFGRDIYIPKHTRPLVPTSLFLRVTFQSFLVNFLILDILEATLKLFPGVGSALGGSMFYWELSPLPRYTVSTLIQGLSGSCLLFGFGTVYDFIVLVAVGFFGSPPESWPPVMYNPWHADSMHAFWSKHWHQVLRQTFLVLGGYPGKWLAGDIGMLFGTFLASGLFHEFAMLSMGRGSDHTVTAFFLLQGVILILERFWRKATGYRVRGKWGQLWVYFVLFIWAQPLVNAWHRRGLGGGMVIPPFLSPARVVLFPLIRRLGSHLM
ncbi:hypothetical protein BDN72DRAFT_636154 [Pluteus cervinus]|uniref:Uncharacterized protein n=1 Tax=Pluteus cervinus TaxID=181527 RepID=A0ACD3BB53_9AGAR|nr:hypothetical protein BDN72DRAFT_636154 [Pluteus cervinus]